MTQAYPGIWYAKKRKIPCYLYVMDLWPENVAYVTGLNSKHIISLIQKMVDYIYKSCDLLFTSSKSFITAIKLRGIKENKIKFWPQYAEEYYKPIDGSRCSEIPQDGVMNIIFAGNIGFAQGLEVLPEAAEILKNRQSIVRFNIVGDGRAKESLLQLVKEKDVTEYFNFVDKQPPQRIPELIGACDISFICLSRSKVFEITLPAKLQSCLACGKPILVSADGEIQNVILSAKAGICADAADALMLADQIGEFMKMDRDKMKEMSKNAMEYSDRHYNKSKLLDEMDQFFI